MGEESKLYDVLILGGGPAGLSSAIYAGRSGLSALIMERGAFGGTIFQASKIANYPGGISGESGMEFSARLSAQADEFGAEKVYATAEEVHLEGKTKKIKAGGNVYLGKTLILSTGAVSVPAKLGVSGEEEYIGRGVSYCAECDGAFFSGLDVFVIGGGDSAIEESLFLANVVRKVTIIHSEDTFQAKKELVDRANEKDNISFILNTSVTEIGGDDFLTRIETENNKTGARIVFEAEENENFGFFVFVGMRPMTDLFDGIDKQDGYIVTDERMHTNIPGVFAAGDVRLKSLRQVVTAAADGAIAATEAKKYLLEVI